MSGVRYARNRVHHQWADALVLMEGARFPMRFPVVFHSWVWRPVDQLPAAPENMPDENGRAAYENKLAGHRSDDVLHVLGEAFWFVGTLLDPPRPARRG